MLNSAEPFDLRECDGYAEAVARENAIRGAACLVDTEVICGLEVKLLCPAHLGLLSAVNYPFHGGYTVAQLCGTKENNFEDGKPDILTDIMRFLWIVSPMYETGSKVTPPQKPKWYDRNLLGGVPKNWRQKPITARDRFNEAFAPILKEPVNKVVSEIIAYITDAFIDCDDSAPSSAKQFFAMQISIASELHEHYGYRIDFWSPDCQPSKNPLLVPLKIIAQLRKHRALRAGEAPLNKSDKLVQAGLDKMAAITERLREYERELSQEKAQDIPPEARVNFDLN